MSEIRNLKPELLWRNFDDLTQIPRPTGHMEKVQAFLLDFAKKVGVEAFVDPAGLRKPQGRHTSGTHGYGATEKS